MIFYCNSFLQIYKLFQNLRIISCEKFHDVEFLKLELSQPIFRSPENRIPNSIFPFQFAFSNRLLQRVKSFFSKSQQLHCISGELKRRKNFFNRRFSKLFRRFVFAKRRSVERMQGTASMGRRSAVRNV